MSKNRDPLGRFAPSVAVSFRRHKVLDLYWQHWSRESIAVELGITLDMVSAYIREGRANGDRRALPRVHKRVIQAQTRRSQIQELAARNMKPTEIARMLNVHVGLVRLRLREAANAA